jgi:ParB-like chromosome segregation protein Spo0J
VKPSVPAIIEVMTDPTVTTEPNTNQPPATDGAKLPRHEAADLFPMMSKSELNDLAADIKQNGLLNPIVKFEGQILDGRNRLAACALAKVEPRFETIEALPNGAAAYVISQNVKRRHLIAAQRAALAVRLAALFEKEGAARKLAGQRKGAATPKNTGKKLGPPKGPQASDAAKSINRAAKLAEVGKNQAASMQAVEKRAPDVVQAVKAGVVTTVADAERLAGVTDPVLREQALGLVKGGESVKQAIAKVAGEEVKPGKKVEPVEPLNENTAEWAAGRALRELTAQWPAGEPRAPLVEAVYTAVLVWVAGIAYWEPGVAQLYRRPAPRSKKAAGSNKAERVNIVSALPAGSVAEKAVI